MTPKDVAKAWFTAIDAKKFEVVKELMDPKHKFHNPMTPGPAGIDEHIGMMQMMTGAFKGQHHLDQFVGEGSHVAIRGRWSGKHVGEFNGVAATGKPVQFSWLDLFHVVNGKVVEEYFEMNPMSIMAQIGAKS